MTAAKKGFVRRFIYWVYTQRFLCSGLVVTVCYLLGLIVLTEATFLDLKVLELNELGDFLAGAVGPIAFLWLILGYVQQSKELKQNTEILDLQRRELANSVKQQEELVRVTREHSDEQLALLRSERNERRKMFLPILTVRQHPIDSNPPTYSFGIQNIGNTATQLGIFSDSDQIEARLYADISMLERGAGTSFIVELLQEVPDEGVLICCTFSDMIMNSYTQEFRLTVNYSNTTPMLTIKEEKKASIQLTAERFDNSM